MTIRLGVFTILSILLLAFTLSRPHRHRFYRFLAFESLLGLVLLNTDTWFRDPFSSIHLFSWIFLASSLVLAIHGFRLLNIDGSPEGDIVHKFLDCGILEHGMARIHCRDCGKDLWVAYSCKTRFLCPSCTQKRKLIWTDWVKNHVLKNIPHRHWIFTIPKVLRKLFYRDRTLLSKLADCAKETIFEMFKVKTEL